MDAEGDNARAEIVEGEGQNSWAGDRVGGREWSTQWRKGAGADMYAIERQMTNRAELRQALLDHFPEGGLFVPGNYDITSGSPVVVRVTASGLSEGVCVEGVVQWRRLAPLGRVAVQGSPGLGVRVLPSQRSRYVFLQRWAEGTLETSGRGDVRYPCELAIRLSSLGRHSGGILHGSLREVGSRGAMVTVPTRLSVANIVLLDVTLEEGSHSLPARVVWSREDRAGLRILLERQEERLVWARLFDSVVSAFARRLVVPRPPSFRPRDPRAE